MKRVKKLNIKPSSERGFLCIRIEDRYGNKIRVQQSSACLTDVWLFVEEKGRLEDGTILLTYENVKDIDAFVRYLRRWC